MRALLLEHLSDADLQRAMPAVFARDRASTAAVVAHIAAFDARQLYLPAGFPSMHSYCVDGHHFSESAAYKRIHAARAAHKYPVLLAALEDGRLHMAAVCMLAPHLTADNVEELVQAATHRRRADIELWLAQRFPQPEMLAIGPVRLPSPAPDVAPLQSSAPAPQLPPGAVERAAPAPLPPAKATPIAPQRYALHLTIDEGLHGKLQRLQELLSHSVPSGDVVQVIERACDALLVELEKRKFAATAKPGRSRPSARRRHIPAHVKRAVWKRDQGQCTFVSDRGRRCQARKFVEFDHADPVARGGTATVDRIRLRCHGHNQYEAEKAFGTQFMRDKRKQTRRQRRAKMAGPRRFG